MQLKSFIFFLCFFSGTCRSYAQDGDKYMQSRILILMDKSSSMINPWDGGIPKSKVSNEFVLKLMDSIYAVNNEVEFSLRVFGHQSTVAENDCKDTRNEVAFGKNNRMQMEYRLDDIQPLGVTSIAYALTEAADNDLVDVTRNAYSIILITDGGESCGGDICAVMRKLSKDKVFFKPYIVNLESSADVKASYACMGDYLEVTRRADIPAAVSKIVNAFRPRITITSKDYTQIKEVAATAPTVLNVTIPVVKMKDTVKTSTLNIEPLTLSTVDKPVMPKAKLVTPPSFTPSFPEEPEKPETVAVAGIVPAGMKLLQAEPLNFNKPKPVSIDPFVPVEETPEKPAPEAIGRLAAASMKATPVTIAAPKTPIPVTIGRFEPLIIEEKPNPDIIARLPIYAREKYPIILVYDGDGESRRFKKVPPIPPYKTEEAPVVKQPAKPAGVAKPLPGKPAEFKVETEDAEQTTVQVYFTNGHGKFYSTTPQVVLLDPYTGNMVKRFYRMVDADGNPDPQTNIDPGTYNLTFSETRSLVVNNLTIEPNKKNKVIITVNKASLSFEYAGNLSRPVTEFTATVIQRNRANGTITTQKCSEKLQYEPENYFVEINTFPIDRRNIDLDFDEKVIRIPQPGFAKFLPAAGMASVTLYEQLGDKFRGFHTYTMSDPSLQRLQIQPGKYEAHFHKAGAGPGTPEKVVVFLIKATEETVVEVK